MSVIIERAADGGALGKLRSEAAQPPPAGSTPMRTDLFEDADQAVRKEHEKYCELFAEAIQPVKDLTHKFTMPAPKLLAIGLELEQTVSDLQSQTIALTKTHHPEATYYALMIKLNVCKDLIRFATTECSSLLQPPKRRELLHFLRAKRSRMQREALLDVLSNLREANHRLESLSSYMRMAAALEQRSEERVLEQRQSLMSIEKRIGKYGTNPDKNRVSEALENTNVLGLISPSGTATRTQQAHLNFGRGQASKGRAVHIKQAIDEWCNPTSRDCDLKRHEYFSSRRLDGTCDWFIHGNKGWQEWLGGRETSSSMLCWGAPGAVKSTIASRVIDELSKADPPLVYAFCYLGDCGMSSPERLVQSLLIQLKTFSSTMPHDSSIYMSNYNSPISYSTKDTAADTIDEAHVHFSTEIGFGSYCTNNILPDSTGPSSSSVKPIVSFQDALEAIIEIISEINRDVFIVFDAWEAEKMERQRTPDYIDLLRTIRSAGCRLFLTSRGVAEPKPDPSILFDMSLPINEADIRDDVENLIQRQMSDMLMEYFRILMIPKFAISIEFDRLKNLLGSFDLATLFVSYMRSIVHKSIAFRPQTLLSLTSKAVVRASAPNPLLIQLAGISNFEPERLIRTSTEFFSTGLSSVQARSVLVWLTFAASPILFEDLGTAMRHISDEPQASRILPNLTITKQIRDKESEYEDLRSILIQLDGLIVWDRGSQLTQLSSKEVGSAVKSLWFSAYQSKTILPSVSGLGILGRICIYCIQYILSVPLEDTSIRSEKAANELLQRHSFLSHAVLNWSRYCREFYVLMTDQTHTHEEVSNDLGNQAEFGQHGQDEERGDQYNAQFWLEIAGLRVDTLKHQSQDQNKYLKFLHDEVSARVSDLIEDKPKIFMAILLAVHSRPDLSSFNNSWEELHSWVTSMPELLMTSHLGLDNAVKDEVRKDPGRLYESDQRGNTALHLAARLGFEDVVCTLLSAGVSVKVLNHSGQTPALYAYKYGQTRAFALIFEKMVTDDVLDTASKLTYDYCDYIVGKQGDNQRSLNLSLFHAIEKSQIAIVRHLLDCGADPDAFNNDNTPVLHYAIQYGEESKTKFSYMRSSCFDLLIRYGADPEIQSKDNKMESSLHVAVRWGKLGAIRWLLRYGVDPCQADSEGRSPLFAVFDRKEQISDSKCSEIVSLLVVKGADRNQSDYKGHRALLLAHQSGLPGVVQLLGGLGAYIDSPHAVAKERVEQATD